WRDDRLNRIRLCDGSRISIHLYYANSGPLVCTEARRTFSHDCLVECLPGPANQRMPGPALVGCGLARQQAARRARHRLSAGGRGEDCRIAKAYASRCPPQECASGVYGDAATDEMTEAHSKVVDPQRLRPGTSRRYLVSKRGCRALAPGL